MPRDNFANLLITALAASHVVIAQSNQGVSDLERHQTHQHSAEAHEDASQPPPVKPAALPEGKTLNDVLEYAERGKPDDFPDPIMDRKVRAFLLFEQLEYRSDPDSGPNQLGWENQGWVGYDFDKFWWKNEGEAAFDGPDEGETETDFLYSRLITPFWSLQFGAQYANEWSHGEYSDRWSGVIALQGLAPYKFEFDNSLYISEEGDATFEVEVEYDLRLTQRLVLQPRAEVGLSFQDVPERMLGEGLTDANLDLRLRYEIKREFAPYMGVRYRTLIGETANIAESAGEDADQFYFLAGVRFAF
jgi:copper resistance protein B